MTEPRPLSKILGDLVDLAVVMLTRPVTPIAECETRHGRLVAELVDLCRDHPSRAVLVDITNVMSICLGKLVQARKAGDARKNAMMESAVGFFLPYLRLEMFEALQWEREQAKP